MLDSCAALASSAAVAPPTGRNSVACRFPMVIVPVLSSSSVFTSPAASTARPDMARTLRCTSRSMPAMPIADSSAPIVVGISATSRATRITRVCGALEEKAIGCSVITASMKMMVSAASRMFSAISFGVFCRLAPSTRAIIRSMKVSPGLEVILTTIRSDSTLVPPVTADRSPPDSRMTGADSPVIADSSTEATPSTTSPSPGMISPASTTTWSPRVSWVPGTASSFSSFWPGCQPKRRRATVSRLVLRSVSAWALPRPSATASAILANSTVSHSQTTMVQLKTAFGPGVLVTAVYRVSSAPTSTTNMTGFLIWTRGSSFLNASGSECQSILGSSRPPPRPFAASADLRPPAGASGVVVIAISVQSFCDRAQRERGEVGQADEHQDHGDHHADEQWRPGVERAHALRHRLLPGQRAGQAEREDLRREPAEQHHDAAQRLVPHRGCAKAGERGAIVVGLRRERVHDLGQAVWARIEDCRLSLVGADGQPGSGQDHHRQGQEVQSRVLHLRRPDRCRVVH